MNKSLAYSALLMACLTPAVRAEDIGCITTTWKLIGSNHKICVQAFDDPKVQGVSCHISQAKITIAKICAPHVAATQIDLSQKTSDELGPLKI